MTEVPWDALNELKDIFNSRFDNEGLAEFAFALSIDYENLSGSTRRTKSMSLAQYIFMHDMFDELAEVGPRVRPDIDWHALLAKYGYAPITLDNEDGQNSEGEPEATLPHTDLQKLVPIVADRLASLSPDGRRSMLTVAGVVDLVTIDINGRPRDVASGLLVQLNEYGQFEEGDSAVGRLLTYIIQDQSLPTSNKAIVEKILATHNLTN